MITIIGAGPAGSYLAYLLAKQGQEVSVYEEHKKIGCPVQCTGLLTNEINNLIKLPKEVIVNKIKKARVYSPNKEYVEFNLKKENYVVDREKFDNYLAKIAASEGAKFYLNSKFIKNESNVLFFKNKTITTDVLIGADGPNSSVAKSNNLFKNRKYVFGIQARIKSKFKDDTFETYFGHGLFAWVVPESSTIARVGLVSEKNTKRLFTNFINKVLGNYKIINYQAGAIPIFNQKQIIEKKNVYLIGDAATQVKPTSFGGIIPGMKAAQLLARSILKKQSYSKLIKENINKDLSRGIFIRKVISRFSDKDYNLLVKYASAPRIKKVYEQIERENIRKLFIKSLISQPKFLRFITKLFTD